MSACNVSYDAYYGLKSIKLKLSFRFNDSCRFARCENYPVLKRKEEIGKSLGVGRSLLFLLCWFLLLLLLALCHIVVHLLTFAHVLDHLHANCVGGCS